MTETLEDLSRAILRFIALKSTPLPLLRYINSMGMTYTSAASSRLLNATHNSKSIWLQNVLQTRVPFFDMPIPVYILVLAYHAYYYQLVQRRRIQVKLQTSLTTTFLPSLRDQLQQIRQYFLTVCKQVPNLLLILQECKVTFPNYQYTKRADPME